MNRVKMPSTGKGFKTDPERVRDHVKTEGGKYDIYGKGSDKSKDFNKAFGDASKSGKSEFEWEGRKYTTEKSSEPGSGDPKTHNEERREYWKDKMGDRTPPVKVRKK